MEEKQKTIALIGATGKTGACVLQEAIKRKYNIVALVRDDKKIKSTDNLTILKGSVSNLEDVTNLISDCDIVISCLGTTSKSNYIVQKGVFNILEAIQSKSTKPKFISMSALGLGSSKEQCKKSLMWRFISTIGFWLIGKELFADMERAENLIIDTNNINYVIARAAILNDKESNGYKTVSLTDKVNEIFISRKDVSLFILDAIENTDYDNQAISLVSA